MVWRFNTFDDAREPTRGFEPQVANIKEQEKQVIISVGWIVVIMFEADVFCVKMATGTSEVYNIPRK